MRFEHKRVDFLESYLEARKYFDLVMIFFLNSSNFEFKKKNMYFQG